MNVELAATLEMVRAHLQAEVAAEKTPGIAVAIVQDDQAIMTEGFGLADVARQMAVTERSLFRVASVTKLFTATALMQLRDAGKLELDDPVTRHLAEFRVQTPFPDCPPIRLRHLVCHASGLPREPLGEHWLTHQPVSMETALQGLAERELLYPPWTELHYSNLGFGVLGKVIERVSGQTLEAYIAEKILRPLEMNDSGLTLSEKSLLATGYYPPEDDSPLTPAPNWELGALTAGGGLYSSARDLAQFMRFQFGEVPTVLRRSTVREMWLPLFLYPNLREGHGIAWWVGQREGRTLIGHGGSVDGYRTQLYLDVERRVGVAVLANTTYDATGTCLRILEWVSATTERIRTPSPKESWDLPGGEEYVGGYRWRGFGEWWVLQANGELVLVPSKDEGTRGAPRLQPLAPDQFRIRGGASNGELARFERDEKGKIVRLWVSAYPYRRVEG